jgi:hypothetical protein
MPKLADTWHLNQLLKRGRIPRVLVSCEFSGTVRDAFARRGWDAWSCDLLPTEKPGNHYQQDLLANDLLYRDWDLVIGHPPCTYLAVSGNAFLTRPGRKEALRQGAFFFRRILECGAPHVAVENPLMTGLAIQIVGRANQVVHPYHFGHLEQKATCFWLRDLPCLVPTDDVRREMMLLPKHIRERNRYIGPGNKDRWKIRSLTYSGIAAAMASQWGAYVERLMATGAARYDPPRPIPPSSPYPARYVPNGSPSPPDPLSSPRTRSLP